MIAPDPAPAGPRPATPRTEAAPPETQERRQTGAAPDFEQVVAEHPGRRDRHAEPAPAECAAGQVVVAPAVVAASPVIAPAPPPDAPAAPVDAAAPAFALAAPADAMPAPNRPSAAAVLAAAQTLPTVAAGSNPAAPASPDTSRALPPPPAGPVTPTATSPNEVPAADPMAAADPRTAADPEAAPRAETAARHETAAPPPAPALGVATVAVATAPAGQPLQQALAPVDGPPPSWSLVPDPAGAARRAESHPGLPPATPVGVVPESVVAQVAVAIDKARDRRVEIRLDPPELGRVQIHLTQTDGRLHALVLADRPDTQDLLRRHADTLTRDLEGAGYGGVDLEFAAGGEAPAERRPPAPARSLALALEGVAAEPAAAAALRRVAAGLDIRL